VKPTLLALAVLTALVGCQDNITTPFPPGLEPFEDNLVDARPDGPFDEGLRTKTSDTDYIHVYGRGFVQAPFDTVWAAARAPAPNIAVCSTSDQTVTENDEPEYDYSFLVHYFVDDIVNVEWDDQWRFGLVETGLGMIKHQKVMGSDFITLSEGSIQVLATSQPDVTELVFVEHLDAVQASSGDVLKGVQHNYDSLVAVAHGNAIPPCP
jgi:hypothetical protein